MLHVACSSNVVIIFSILWKVCDDLYKTALVTIFRKVSGVTIWHVYCNKITYDSIKS